MTKDELRQYVMDSVIEFFSGTVLDKVFTNEAICIMNEYSIEWNKSDATYDDPKGSEELDAIIDNCVDEVMKLEKILLIEVSNEN